MQPVQQLIHRIKWDPEFGRGVFALAYYDRVAHEEKIVPFESVGLTREDPGSFSLTDEDGIVRHIPLHRVRAVYKDGKIIWQRAGR